MFVHPTAEDVIAEACALLLASNFDSIRVRVEDASSPCPLVIVTVRVRFWQWISFDPMAIEQRVVSFLKLIARGRQFRVRVAPE